MDATVLTVQFVGQDLWLDVEGGGVQGEGGN